MDVNALRAAMAYNGITGRKLSKALGISEAATYDKINGKVEFKLSETAIVIKELKLSEDQARDIFYPSVEYYST